MKPKILAFDIETAPLLVYTWGIGEQFVSIDQIHTDWKLMSFAAKWVGESSMFYQDRRKTVSEKPLLDALWKLLDEADIVLTQNGKKFDAKKVNAKFIEYKMQPPSTYKHIDTLQISRRVFGFTSNKLAYTTDKLCEIKKSEHRKYPGLELWLECLAGNQDAWKEMEKYNKRDVTSLEELYKRLAPWDQSVNLALYHDEPLQSCSCGGNEFKANGFFYSAVGKFQRFRCKKCGAEGRHSKNLFTRSKTESLLRKTR